MKKNGNKHSMLGNFSWCRGAALAMFLPLLLGACSDSKEMTPERAAALEQRVWARWQTLMDRDFEKTWEFASPNYRSIFSKRMFSNKFSYGLEWELTEVKVVTYDGDAAVASVVTRVMTKSTNPTASAFKAFGSRPIIIRERWMFIDGEWWHIANI